MDRRTKILAIGFLAIIGYTVVAKLAYPKWIRPLMTYGERVADRQEELDELLVVEKEVDAGRFEYKAYVERTGSFDIVKVENRIRQQLNTLIELHELKEANVTPSRKSEDRKTKIWKMTLTVQAEGALQGVAGLLRDVAELPHMIRFGTVAIKPGRSTLRGGRPTLHEQVSLRLPIELWVLPQHRSVGQIDATTLAEVEPVIRHQQRDYASLWTGRPFSEYLKPQKLSADAGDDQRLSRPGRSLVLRGKMKGGIGEYTVQWSPSDGLQNPTAMVTKLDTSAAGEFIYTLSVTDETGATSSDDVTITIDEPRKQVVRDKKPRENPADLGPKRWKDGRYMQFVMMLGRTHNGNSTNEMMVFDRKARQSSYFAPGDEFDGGKLVCVHQTGGLVHRKDGYYVYPIGAQLDQDLKLEDAAMYFELREAAERHRDGLAGEREAKAAPDAAKAESGADQAAAAPDAGEEKKAEAPERVEAGSAPEAAQEKDAVTPPETSGEGARTPSAKRTAPRSGKKPRGLEAMPRRPNRQRPNGVGRKPK